MGSIPLKHAVRVLRVFTLSIDTQLEQLVLEKMEECTEVLAVKYLKSVRPIYGSNINHNPIHIGSCIFIEINQHKILLTAAHIIDKNEITTLYVSGKEKLVKLDGACEISTKVEGSRKKDKFDFAIIILTKQMIESLGNIEFLNKSDLYLKKEPAQKGLFMALGYPNSKNKKPNNIEKTVTLNPFVYSSKLIQNESLFKEIDTFSDTHYLLDFCHKHSKDSTGNITNSIAPKGISGGGLFHIDCLSSLKTYLPDSKCSGKLIGLLIEHKKNHKVLLATNILSILNSNKLLKNGLA